MTCYHPLTGYISRKPNPSGKFPIVFNIHDGWIDRKVQVPCGRCIGCRKAQVAQWAIRILHEADMFSENCFITLTYDDDHVPSDGSLHPEDFVNFMKRLRKHFSGRKIRFFQTGEYGSKNNRPHHHCVLFGFNFDDRRHVLVANGAVVEVSNVLSDLWGKGFVTVGDLNEERAKYVARYIVKKFNNELAATEYGGRKPPYSTMSRRGGIGEQWVLHNFSDVYSLDRVVYGKGYLTKPPRYYDNKFALTNKEKLDKIKGARERTMLKNKFSRRVRRLRDREKYQEYILEKKRREHEVTGI